MAISLLAVGALFGVGYVLDGLSPESSHEYYWTEAMWELIGVESSLLAAIVLLALAWFPLGYYALSAVLLFSPLYAAMAYELFAYPASHNLIPFEIALCVLASFAIHAPSLIWKLIRTRIISRKSAPRTQPRVD